MGTLVEVAGTSATDEGGVAQARNDPYGQTILILREVLGAIEALGGCAGDVVRTRIYLVRIADWPAVARAHGEVFHDINPASTIVEISGLLLPDLLVEIEATAIVGSGSDI